MTEFTFQGRNAQGELVNGRRSATSRIALATQLQRDGILPIKIEDSVSSDDWQVQLMNMLQRRSVEKSELVLFCRQMRALTAAGIPVTQAISRIAETVENNFFQDLLRQIVESISSGIELSRALQIHAKYFPELMINLIRVGENTGHLSEAFGEIIDYLELEINTKKRIKSAVRYPVIVCIAIFAAIGIINLFVIPAFTQVFANMDVALPLITRLMLGFSSFLVTYWLLILLATVSSSFFVMMYLRSPEGRLQWHHMQLKMPIVGSILQKINMVRFSKTLAIVMRSGIPIDRGIDHVSMAIDNAYIRERILSIKDSVSRGDSLAKAARQTGLFTPLVLQMIVIGEESGRLDDMLTEVASFYEEEVDYALKNLGEAIEPILLLFIGGLVLLLALGVFLPMWDITGLAKG